MKQLFISILFLLFLVTPCYGFQLITGTPPIEVAALIHSDDWETDDFSKWDSEFDPDGDLSTQAAPGVGHGTYSYEIIVDDTDSCHLEEIFAEGYSEFTIVWYMYFIAGTGVTDNKYIMLIRVVDADTNSIFYLRLYIGASTNTFDRHDVYYTHDSGTSHSDWDLDYEATATWYKYEFYMKKATAPLANDGIVRFWVDDVLRVELTNVDSDGINDAKAIRLGVYATDFDQTDWVFYLDDYQFWSGYKDF